MRRVVLGAVLAMLTLLAAPATGLAQKYPSSVPRAKHVVVVDWDGFDPEYLNRAQTPTLDALARRGSFAIATGTFPTISNPSRATMVTGAWPEVHRNAAYFLDREANVAVGQTRRLDAQTIAEAVGAAGGTVASVQWYILQDHGTAYGDPEHLYVQPGGRCERRVDVALDILAGRPVRSGSEDVTVPAIPNLLGLYCDDLDARGHAVGADSPELPATLEELDRQLARLVQGVKDAGVYDETAFIVTSDHGMTTFTQRFGDEVLAALRDAGFSPEFLAGGRSPAPETDIVFTVGGAASFYLLGDAASRDGLERARTALEALPQVRHVFDRAAMRRVFRASPQQGDLVADPQPGWSFAPGADPASPVGQHGTTGDLKVPFVMAGAGVRRGAAPLRPQLVDLAPTVSALLGIPAPAQAQGRVLRESLKKRRARR